MCANLQEDLLPRRHGGLWLSCGGNVVDDVERSFCDRLSCVPSDGSRGRPEIPWLLEAGKRRVVLGGPVCCCLVTRVLMFGVEMGSAPGVDGGWPETTPTEAGGSERWLGYIPTSCSGRYRPTTAAPPLPYPCPSVGRRRSRPTTCHMSIYAGKRHNPHIEVHEVL